MSGEEQNTLTVYSGRVLAALQRDTDTIRPRLDTRYLYTRSFPGLYPETAVPVRSGMPRQSSTNAGARVKRQHNLPSLEVALSKKISPRLENISRVGESRLKTSHIPGKMQSEMPSWKERREKLKATKTAAEQTEQEKRIPDDVSAEMDRTNVEHADSTAVKPREPRFNQLPGLSTKIEVTLPTNFDPPSGEASSSSLLTPLSSRGKVHLAGPMNKMDKIVEYSTQLKEGVIDYDMYMTKLALLSLQTQIRDVPRRNASKGPKGELRIAKVNIEDAIDHISAGPLLRSDAPEPDQPEPLLYRKLATTRPTIPHSTRVIVGHTLTRRRGADRGRYPRATFPMYDWNLHQAETLLRRNFGFYNYNVAPLKTKPAPRDVLRPLEKPPTEIRPKTFRLPSFGRLSTASREGTVDPRAALSSRGKLPTPAGSDVFQGHLKNVYASIEKAKVTNDENGDTPIPIVLSPATEDTKTIPEQDFTFESGLGRPDLLQLPSPLSLPTEGPLSAATVPALGLNAPGTPPLAVPGSPPPKSRTKLDPNADNSLTVVPLAKDGEKTVSFSAKLEVFMPDSPETEVTNSEMDFI